MCHYWLFITSDMTRFKGLIYINRWLAFSLFMKTRACFKPYLYKSKPWLYSFLHVGRFLEQSRSGRDMSWDMLIKRVWSSVVDQQYYSHIRGFQATSSQILNSSHDYHGYKVLWRRCVLYSTCAKRDNKFYYIYFTHIFHLDWLKWAKRRGCTTH